MFMFRYWYFVACLFSTSLFSGCRKEKPKDKLSDSINSAVIGKKASLFTLLSPQQTNIDFSNTLIEGPNTNILVYEYFYNGGGVATGDFNGDGLIDIYFSSNMGKNKLYLNRGNMRFEDITNASGAAGKDGP